MRSFSRLWKLLGAFGAAVALTAAPPPLAAQSGSVSGQVTDRSTGQPLQAARLQVTQTGKVVAVRFDGRYTIADLAPGNYDIRVISVGYAAERKPVTVTAGQTTTLDFALNPVPYTIEEIVTTATGEQRRLELGHTVGVLRADSIASLQPVNNMQTLLQARSAGVVILPSSGSVGTGARIRIRGANSLSLSNEPIIYIDGVKVNTVASSSSLGTGGQAPSRLNDINPDEIESIEIVKGPSAATLYGTEAANGVIRVTTKRGTAGKPRWNVYLEGGVLTDPNKYPDNYRSVGRTITGGVPGGALRTCLLTQIASNTCTQETLFKTNILENDTLTPISRGWRQQYGANVTGGTELVQYFFSGEFEDEIGTFALPDSEKTRLLTARSVSELPKNVLRPNTNRRISLRSNLATHLRSNVDVQANVGYVIGNLRLPQNDNNVLGMLPSGYFGTTDTLGKAGWGFFAPGEIFSLERNQRIERFTGSGQIQWRPFSWLSGRGVVGYDIGQRTDITFDPTALGPAFGTTPLGTKGDTRTQLKTYTVDAGFTANYRLLSNLSSRTSVGGQLYRDVFFQNSAIGQRLTFGSSDIDGAAILTASQTTTTTVRIGAFAEEQLNYKDRLFLTGAFRVDDNSSFGADFNAIVFPKASISYVLSDEPFFPKGSFISLLRLRGAYGQSGLQPGALDALTYLAPTASAVSGASTSAVTFGGFGLAGLKPEKSRERELGADVSLFRDRINVDFTYFHKETTDALIARVLAPSLGVTNFRFENLGSVSNQGFELTLNARVIDHRDVSWDAVFAGSTIKNRLDELGFDASGKPIPPVISGVQRHTVGRPLGAFFDRPILSFDDANDNGIIELSEVVMGDTAVYIGSSQPTRQFSLSQILTLFRGKLRLLAQLDYQGGFRQQNLTEEFRCNATGNNCQAMHDPNTPLDLQARAVARRFHGSQTAFGYIEDGEFMKLRELALTYTLPDRWANALMAQRANITIAGRNLHTWTGYTGVDPEVNQSGQVAFNGFGVRDFLTQPPIRTF
ncbi:MAG TPA: SusC/RagA family TonB-linked outer membrane protein, partial [Gemmatimonadales bacterium]|nr:SusC/RagA family TonB-linked outer membrane protein [Gemmatimonadales bacterium]